MPTFRDNLLKLIHNRVFFCIYTRNAVMKLKASVAYIYMFYFPPMLPVFSSLSLDSWQPVKRRYNSQTAVYLKLVWASAHRMASSHPETHLLSNFFLLILVKVFRKNDMVYCSYQNLGHFKPIAVF